MQRFVPLALICLLACACGDAKDADAPADLPDMGLMDVDEPDAETPDAGEPDAETPDVPPAEEDVPDIEPPPALRGDLGGGAQDFGRIFYGLTDPMVLGEQDWGIHIEAHVGGMGGCPQQDSPTPDATLILSGLTATDADPSEVTVPDMAGATLLDFGGMILNGEVLTRASAVSVTLLEADVCTSCAGQPAPSHAEGFVTLQVEATFPEGTVTGQLQASHCDSMDELAP